MIPYRHYSWKIVCLEIPPINIENLPEKKNANYYIIIFVKRSSKPIFTTSIISLIHDTRTWNIIAIQPIQVFLSFTMVSWRASLKNWITNQVLICTYIMYNIIVFKCHIYLFFNKKVINLNNMTVVIISTLTFGLRNSNNDLSTRCVNWIFRALWWI